MTLLTSTMEFCEYCGGSVPKRKHGGFTKRFCCKTCKTSARTRRKVNERRERLDVLKQEFIRLMGGKCQNCGYHMHMVALVFHHVDRSDKDGAPSSIFRAGNTEIAYGECDKCALLCSNCHLALHFGDVKMEFIKRPGGLGWMCAR